VGVAVEVGPLVPAALCGGGSDAKHRQGLFASLFASFGWAGQGNISALAVAKIILIVLPWMNLMCCSSN